MSNRAVTMDDLRRVADAIREIGAALVESGSVSESAAKRIRAARYLVAELATENPLEDSGFHDAQKTDAGGAFTLPPLPEDEWK